MADNSAEIARLQSILDAGTESVNVDGTSVRFDLDEVRRRLRELQATDDTPVVKRPRASSIDLGGF